MTHGFSDELELDGDGLVVAILRKQIDEFEGKVGDDYNPALCVTCGFAIPVKNNSEDALEEPIIDCPQCGTQQQAFFHDAYDGEEDEELDGWVTELIDDSYDAS